MTRKVLLVLHTVIHLRPIQIRYQIWYRLRKIWRKPTGFKCLLSVPKYGHPLKFTPWIEKNTSLSGSAFSFLNSLKKFENRDINWNESEFGKLWTYNLNYMEFLLQPGMDVETGMELIQDFIEKLNQKSVGIEPYPIALRGINWIKFFSKSNVTGSAAKQTANNSSINALLCAHYNILLNSLEYHLLGNHLLEDGFSLLFGAFYFKNIPFYKKANHIVSGDMLNEQDIFYALKV